MGLNLRVSARLAAELLHCITSITPRARYYSFFPWAFQDYIDHEHGRARDRGRTKGVLARERAMVLGAVLHHDGAPCVGGSLGGSDLAWNLAQGKRKSHDLQAWQHLKAKEGQFGAAYKASLINLGLFKTDDNTNVLNDDAAPETNELDDVVQSIEVKELSGRGKRLAQAFLQSIRSAQYIKDGWSCRNVVDTAVLKEFGSHAGLCEVSGKRAADRSVLRDIFFACDEESTETGQYRRRMSLLLLLECIGQANMAGVFFDNDCLNDITYFGAIVPDAEELKTKPISLPQSLRDIAERWRVFFSHGYLTEALQSMLVATVRILRHRQGGVTRSSLLDEFAASAMRARFRELFERDLPDDFLRLTPRETLAITGVTYQNKSDKVDATIDAMPIESRFSERNIASLLIDGEANEAAGVVLAAILFYTVLVRYPQTVGAPFNNWYARHVGQPYTDISVPGVLDMLRAEYGETWWHRSNREILEGVIWRFVVRQHQTMSYERGFGGSAPLFHVDGAVVIGTDTDYTDPRALNARLGSALQILTDLGLTYSDEDRGYRRTDEGDAWLRTELEREAQR